MRSARAIWPPLLLAMVLAALLLGLGTVPAECVAPLELQGQVTDQVGVLDDSGSAILSEFAQVEAEHDVRMWVVFVASFDGMDPQAWTDATFRATGLADRDYLLAVSTGDRRYGYVVRNAFPLNDAALARVADAARQHLAEYPDQAVLAAAAAMKDELAGKTTEDLIGWALGGLFLVMVVISIVVNRGRAGGSTGVWQSSDSFTSAGSGGGSSDDTRGGEGGY